MRISYGPSRQKDSDAKISEVRRAVIRELPSRLPHIHVDDLATSCGSSAMPAAKRSTLQTSLPELQQCLEDLKGDL